jgi:hypothetical protein
VEGPPWDRHCEPVDDGVASLVERHEALLERVTVLERGLETIATWAEYGYQDLSGMGVLSCVKKKARELLDA